LRRRLRQQDSGLHRISRIEEYGIGSARPGFQGHVKLGFRADGKMLAADLYIVQENGPHIGGGDFRSAGNALSIVYQPEAMRWRAVPVLTNTPPVGPQRGPGESSTSTGWPSVGSTRRIPQARSARIAAR
jgi:CO/xanthine dehydrogenase Mo-binding subunit